MQPIDYSTVLAMLDGERVDIESVGAFWQQARRARLPGVKLPVAAIPVTFHVVGELRSVAYGQLLAGPGMREACKLSPRPTLVWQQRTGDMAPLAFAEFALPMLGLFWTGTDDTQAIALGGRLLEILSAEFPNPEWELEQAFGMTQERVFAHLAETEFLQAGATLRSTK